MQHELWVDIEFVELWFGNPWPGDANWEAFKLVRNAYLAKHGISEAEYDKIIEWRLELIWAFRDAGLNHPFK